MRPFILRAVSLTLVAALAVGVATSSSHAADDEDDDDEDEEEVVPATPCARLVYEDEEEPLPFAIRADRSGGCLVVGGEARLGHHWQSQKGSGGLIGLVAPGGRQLSNNTAFSFSAALKVEWHSFTEAGRFGVVTEAGWQTTQNDGLDRGLLQLRKAYFRANGFRVGFGDSYTNFFDMPLLTAAFTPKRSVGFVGHEWSIGESTRFAIAVETGPTYGSAQLRVVPVSLEAKPYYVARLQHDFTGFEVHAAAVYTRKSRVDALTGSSSALDGFALTAGARFDVPVLGTKDSLALQATWARNAPAYLGSAIDLNSLGSQLVDHTRSTAYSGIAAYTRNWTEQWSSTAYASGAVLASTGPGKIRTASLRYGANLVYEPRKGFRIGLEGAVQRSTVERDPILAIRPGQRLSATGMSLLLGAQASF